MTYTLHKHFQLVEKALIADLCVHAKNCAQLRLSDA